MDAYVDIEGREFTIVDPSDDGIAVSFKPDGDRPYRDWMHLIGPPADVRRLLTAMLAALPADPLPLATREEIAAVPPEAA